MFEIERQSLTLSTDALVVCLQLISSFRWKLIIADVEGAVLQGEPINRKNSKIFVKIPKGGVPGLNSDDVVQVTKCVYGLADAAWWLSFSKAGWPTYVLWVWFDLSWILVFSIGTMRTVWVLGGVICLHVDDMVVGGCEEFHVQVLDRLNKRYPFKHWQPGSGMF